MAGAKQFLRLSPPHTNKPPEVPYMLIGSPPYDEVVMM
jgi:hypothetical protein